MRLTTSLRTTAVALALAALLAPGSTATASPAPAATGAATTAAECRTEARAEDHAHQTSAGAAARSAAAGTAGAVRGRDHREVSPAEQRSIEQRTDQLLAQRTAGAAAAVRDVPVYVHVMAGEDGEGDVTRAAVRRQVRVLDRTYEGSGFDFDLAGIDRTFDDRYHQDRRSAEYRSETRRGGAGALNIWLVDFAYLGVATFPWDQERSPRVDGVRVQVGTLPGGDVEGFDQGKTATHEVGHWLGLYHTFQGGCTRRNDLVRDTPAQGRQSSGCPVGNDTCSLPGRDPVHNYMDYSEDACYERFSAGQLARMRAAFDAYRA